MSEAGHLVLDSSVALGWMFEDERDDYCAAVLRHLEHHAAWVPWLWHLELANILARAVRLGRIDPQAAGAALDLTAALPISAVALSEPGGFWMTRSLALGLSAYDSCYLELAQRRRLPLATRDAALAAAAQAHGVRLWRPPG